MRLYQSIRGPGTSSRQLEQPEHQQQKAADPVPCDMSTGVLGPTDDAGGTVDATTSTKASSQMNSTVTPDATTSAQAITRGTSSSFIVAATPMPNNQNGLWSTSSKFATEPTSTVKLASSQTNVSVAPDATTHAEMITPGSSSSYVDTSLPLCSRLIVSTGFVQTLAPMSQNRQALSDSPS